jgi:hypothetical protein
VLVIRVEKFLYNIFYSRQTVVQYILPSVFKNISSEVYDINFLKSIFKLNIIRVIKSRRMRLRQMRNTYSIWIGKPERKRPLGRPRRRCEYNIRMDLRETGWEDVDSIHLAQGRDK